MVNNEIKCNGLIYKLVVGLHNGNSIPQLLDCAGIISLIYSNSIGDIFVTGDLRYIDKDSVVPLFLNRQDTIISIVLTLVKRTITTNDNGESILNDEIITSYSNEFLVTNFDILSNGMNAFEYRIYFISKHIISCNKYILFSNYNESKSITDIIHSIFKTKCNILCDDLTFKDNASDVKRKYISGLYDTAISIMLYLLNTLFFYPSVYDKKIRTVIYDDTLDRMTLYKVGGNKNYPVKTTHIKLRYMSNKVDPTSDDAPVNIAGVCNTQTYEVTELFRDHKFYDYSYVNGFKDGTIDANSIKNYYESEGKGMYLVNKELNTYPARHALWSNNIDVYTHTLQALVGNNGLIANVYGTIGLIPGMETAVTIDIDRLLVGGTDTNIVDSKVKTYSTIAKGYVISKVVNIISFTGDSGIFRLNLHLMTASLF